MDIEILASGSKGNCYKIKTNGTTLLIECGISFKEIQKKLKFKMHEIDACLITHSHKDHSKAVKYMLKSGIDCYMSYGTAEELEVLNHHRTKIFNHNGNHIYVNEMINNLYVKTFKAVHDTKEPIGFVIADGENNKLVFMTDTAYSPYNICGMTHLMIECNYVKKTLDENVQDGVLDINLRNRIVQNHMSLETVIGFLKANDLSKLKKIYVMHLSEHNSDEELIKSEIQKVTGKSVVIC